jgi:hypothetical protein
MMISPWFISDLWTNVDQYCGNVPVSPVNVIAEDNINENILYLGTDNGLYVSFEQREKLGRFFEWYAKCSCP